MYNTKQIEGIREFMMKQHKTLSVAESVTSGHLQAALSLADGATEFFQGGITAYNLGQKSRHLKIDPIHALSCNCVSEKVAEDMAIHCLELFSSDWAISITGYAAPVPELEINDLFAFFSIASDNKIILTKKITSKEQGILKVQIDYADTVLKEFNQILKNLYKKNPAWDTSGI